MRIILIVWEHYFSRPKVVVGESYIVLNELTMHFELEGHIINRLFPLLFEFIGLISFNQSYNDIKTSPNENQLFY